MRCRRFESCRGRGDCKLRGREGNARDGGARTGRAGSAPEVPQGRGRGAAEQGGGEGGAATGDRGRCGEAEAEAEPRETDGNRSGSGGRPEGGLERLQGKELFPAPDRKLGDV